jgi:hypothetical protein
MTDAFIHLVVSYEFTIGFMAGSIVFFFTGLAIGWAKGNANGWREACLEVKEHNERNDQYIHKW